jgi:hypothetical protein
LTVLLSPQLGYYSLFVNVCSLMAAKLLPLEFVPVFFLLASLLVQMLAFVVLLFSKAAIYDRYWKKLLACFLLLFTLLSAEVWLNTLNSQYFFSLLTFLILLEPSRLLGKTKKYCYRGLLAMAGLTGVVSLFLAPVYFVSLFWERTRERWIQSGILLSAAVFQSLVFLSTYAEESLYFTRFQGVEFLLFPPTILMRSFFVPLVGPEWSELLREIFMSLMLSPGLFFLGSSLFLSAFLALFSCLIERRERVLYLGSYVSLLFFSLLASLGDSSAFLEEVFMAQRYFYVANVVLLMMLFRNLQKALENKRSLMAFVSVLILLCALFHGMLFFRTGLRYQETSPRWSEEISRWRADPRYELQISPPGWKIRLPDYYEQPSMNELR